MKILHLLASPVWSGPAELVVRLALGQRRLGHEVSIAVDRLRPGTRHPSEEPLVPRLQALELLDEGGLELSVKSTPWHALQDLRRLRQRQVDVMHAHASHDHSLARLAAPRSISVIRSVHHPRSLRWSLPRADAVTVPWDTLLTSTGRTPAVVLPALVDPLFVPPTDRPALQRSLSWNSEPLVGMVSSFQPSRGHLCGLEAFVKLLERQPGARLVLIGDGEEEAAIRARTVELKIDHRVTFTGYLSGAKFIEALQALDVVWILGLGSEFSGRAAAQGRACGVKVVALNAGALSRYADALVELDPEEIAAATINAPLKALPLDNEPEITARIMGLYRTAGADL